MADNNKSPWEKVLEQVSSPWDWAAGAAGATVGVAGTFALGGSDFGASIAAGFTAGIAARKALYASLVVCGLSFATN